MSVVTEVRYWDRVGGLAKERHAQRLWRAHSDTVNTVWLRPRLSGSAAGRLLKTDLFDEARGAGLFPLLSDRANHVVGIDIAASTLHAARVRYVPLQSVGADVRTLPFAASVFDGVVSNSTLDHFPTADGIVAGLNELHRVLRPGGQLLLTLDNRANPLVALRNVLPFGPLNALGIVPYQVGATCGPQELRRIVCAAGFEVLEVGAILHCPRVLAVAAARIVERYGSEQAQRRFQRFLMAFERLADWPTRFLSGYFVAVVARKP